MQNFLQPFSSLALNKLFSQSQACYFGTKKISVREALNSALKEEMERDQTVFLIGEEIARAGGAYEVTRGLLDEFGPQRVVDSPIAEQGFTGMAVGAALYGLRPVVDFMSFNFALQAMDQIVNSSGKIRFMSGGELSCPIVFRGPNGASLAVGASHSQCFASLYSNVPGLIVLCPFDSEDARGLLKAAIRDPNPVVFLENEILYDDVFEVDDKVLDKNFLSPIGKIRVMKEGTDITIVSYSRALRTSLQAAQELEKEGISCEVINIRTFRPLDHEGIIKSAKKTHHLITVEEGYPQSGVGAEISAIMMESSAFPFLHAPTQRVTAADTPLPYNFLMEIHSLPQVHNIKRVVKQVLKKK